MEIRKHDRQIAGIIRSLNDHDNPLDGQCKTWQQVLKYLVI